jgi:N-acetylmuramoyl-L-alanine amidase
LLPTPHACARARRAVVHWARWNRIDPKLARALAWVESGFQPSVVSSTGAWGVMQVMPGTWRFVEDSLLGTDVPRTPPGNIRVGLRYLRYLLDDFGGRERRALAAYNQGSGSLREVGMYPETRRFVRAVLGLRARL